MTLEEVIKQRLAEAQKQVVLESTKKEPVKQVEPEEVGDEVDTSPKLKKKISEAKNRDDIYDSEPNYNSSTKTERLDQNKKWNSHGHKEVSKDYMTGVDDDDKSDSYSVKTDKEYKIKTAAVHDRDFGNGVPEYKIWNKDQAKNIPITVPTGQTVVVTDDHIYGHHPEHGYFRADRRDNNSISKLSRSYDPNLNKLTKESLDAMSQEEFDSLVEDYEQLDELSKYTLKSYIRKANDSIDKIGPSIDDDEDTKEYQEKWVKANKREQNINKATKKVKNKLTQEGTTSSQVSALLEAEELEIPAHIYKSSMTDGKISKPWFTSNGYTHDKETNLLKKNGKLYKIDSTVKIGNPSKLILKEFVSDQVSALLEAEGLSQEFKEQAVTIFEAAVTDRVLQIKEELQEEFEAQLAEAKSEMEDDIDGFLSEAILQWKAENEVAIKSNFKTQLAESFIDGMKALIAEHNIDVPEGQEDALEVALKEVEKLNEQFSTKDQEIGSLQEQINQLKADKILESFKSKMTQTEFDRFSQLTESVKFKDEGQYEKQLNVVLENFGSTKKETKPVMTEQVITEQIADVKIVKESDSKVNAYAQFLSKKR